MDHEDNSGKIAEIYMPVSKEHKIVLKNIH